MATEENDKNKVFQYVNTFLLSAIMILMTYGSVTIRTVLNNQNDQNVTIAVMSSNLTSLNDNDVDYNDRLKKIETGQIAATADRITKTEALAAIERLRDYIDKNFQRKK